LGRIGAVRLGHARVKAAAQQGGEAGVLELLFVGPLPGVVEVGGEAFLPAALLIDGAPGRVVGVLGLAVGSVHVVDAAGQAGVHDGQVLVGQRDVHDQVRPVAFDEGDELVHIVGVHLGGGDPGAGDGGQLFGQSVAFGFRAAGDAQLAENVADLAALLDGYAGNAAAADDKNFAHSDDSFMYDFLNEYSRTGWLRENGGVKTPPYGATRQGTVAGRGVSSPDRSVTF